MTPQEIFQQGTDTFNAHDIDGFTATLTDDVTFEAPGAMRGQGKAPCAQFYASWFEGFPDAHVEVHRVHFSHDVAVEEGTFTGTHHGTLHTPTGDVPATGRAVAIPYVQVLRFRDGKHASFRLMFDRLEMAEALGILQPA